MHVDLVIKNGRIADGTGSPVYTSDIAIDGGRIFDIGQLGELRAKKIIDAGGKLVSPGFIDIHTHNDFYVNREHLSKVFEPYVRQGITTCITGNCGWGVAPIAENHRDLLMSTLGSISVSVDLPLEWSTIDEYLVAVDRKGPVLNMAHLVPHGLLRMAVMGERNTFATTSDIDQMKRLLRDGMEAGCYGFSTGLMYYPGIYSHTDELIQLNAVCGEYGGRYATHLRAQCTTFPYAVKEAIEIARKGKTGLQISHFHAKPFLGRKASVLYHLIGCLEAVNNIIPLPPIPNDALRQGIEIVDEATADGLDFGMDMVPYIMANTTITAVFPPWALIGGTQQLLKRLANDETWAKIKYDMQNVVPQWPPWGERSWSDNYSKALGWHIIRILEVHTDEGEGLEGKSMMEIAKERRIDPWEAARQLTLQASGKVSIRAGFPSRPWIEKFSNALFAHPQMSVMCDAIIPEMGKPPQAAYGAFPRFLGRHVRELRILSLPEAIRRITSLPAARYGIKDRGAIRKGYHADIVVFDDETICDRSTPDRPDVFPDGISLVTINGKIVLEGQKYDDAADAGRILRKYRD